MDNYVFKLHADCTFNKKQKLNFYIGFDPTVVESENLIKILEGIILFFDKIRNVGVAVNLHYQPYSYLAFAFSNLRKNTLISDKLKNSISGKGMVSFVLSNFEFIDFIIWDGGSRCYGELIENKILRPEHQPDEEIFWVLNTFSEQVYDDEFYRKQIKYDDLPF